MPSAKADIEMLYLLRWRIEKVFDTGKNRLEETKAWATGEVARELHGHFSSLTHNLLVLLRGRLHRDHGLREVKIEKKRSQWLKKRAQTAQSSKREAHPIQRKLPPIVQMSLQFIRTLRNGIIARMRWLAALPCFAAMLNSYL